MFNCLKILLTATDDDCPAVIDNLWKARKSWSCMAQTLRREGVDTNTEWRLYVTVVQFILMFGSETWVVTPQIKWMLGGFHHKVVRRILGKIPQWRSEGMWEYPLWVT